MGMRRRTRRRGLIAGAAIGAGVAHHQGKKNADEAYEQGAADQQDAAQQAPAAAPEPESDVPTNDIEELAKLHASGALTDEEFAAAKAKVLGI